MSKPQKLFCLIGASGSGKDTIAREIGLPQVVSYRTRPIREGEVDGIHGHFIDKETFLKLDKVNTWIAKTNYAGNYYGVTENDLMQLQDSPMVYVVDWDGVVTLKEGISNIEGFSPDQVVTVYIHVDRDTLRQRMTNRGTDNETIKLRLDRINEDIKAASKCDYILVNDDGKLNETLLQLHKIILKESFSIK